jgi:hypothetical protein
MIMAAATISAARTSLSAIRLATFAALKPALVFSVVSGAERSSDLRLQERL